MDIGFDREGWTNDPADGASGKTGSLEWHGLRARLSAARAARPALADDGCALGRVRAGSFNGISAQALTGYGQPQAPVNPVPWSDGKRTQPMDAAVASGNHPGERG